MDQELFNVAWVTAAVVAATGATMMALALTCKALQRCYIRFRRQRSQLRRHQQQQQPTAAATPASVAATATSATVTPHNDSFDAFLQLSFNSQQPVAAAATNGPQQLASRSPRGRSVAVLRSPADPGSRHGKASPAAGFKLQPQRILDSGRSMTFEIRASEDSEEDSEAADSYSCEDSRQRQQKSNTSSNRPPAATRTSGIASSFYDHGSYDMEWPPASSGRQAAQGGDGWHSARQQQQQQGRRGLIFFGRGASHGSGRYGGNL